MPEGWSKPFPNLGQPEKTDSYQPVRLMIDGSLHVAKSAFILNETLSLYQVKSPKTLKLVSMTITGGSSAIGNRCIVSIRSNNDTVAYNLFDYYFFTAGMVSGSITFPEPLPIPSGWSIYGSADAGTCYINVFFTGWEK